jgi:hypothetical protein
LSMDLLKRMNYTIFKTAADIVARSLTEGLPQL